MGDPIQVRVGDEGVTGSVLRPGGVVIIAGQRFSARSHGDLVEEGTTVLVTGGDNHGFTVQTVDRVEVRESLPNYGEPAYSNFGSSKKAQALRDEEAMRRWHVARKRSVRRIGPVTGGFFAALIWGFLWKELYSSIPTAQLLGVSAGIVGLGAIVGFLFLSLIDGFLREIDFVLYRFSLPTMCFFFFGLGIGVIWSLPRYGISSSLLCGAACGLLCGLPLPVVAAFVAVGGGSDNRSQVGQSSQTQAK